MIIIAFPFPASNFYDSPYIPNPNTCKATNNNSTKIRLMMSDKASWNPF